MQNKRTFKDNLVYEAKVEQFIGQKFKQYRISKGYTQRQVAEFLGVSFQQVQKYEGGKNRISAGRLAMMAQKLKVPLSFFFYESEEERLQEILQEDIWLEAVKTVQSPVLLYHLLNIILYLGQEQEEKPRF